MAFAYDVRAGIVCLGGNVLFVTDSYKRASGNGFWACRSEKEALIII